MIETLQEYADARGAALGVDRAAAVIRGVKILGLSSRNGRSYSPEALTASIGLYESVKVNVNHPKGGPLAPRDYQDRIGVIRGVSLRADEGLFAEIRALLLRYKVLFLHDQDFTRAEHVAFARRFGDLEDHPVVGSDPEHPGLVRIYKGPDSRNEQYENAWHCDTTWRESPQFGAVLRCTEVPAVGGDMLWANMAMAYEQLPAHVKTQIAGLRARHSIEASFGAAMPIEKRLALKAHTRFDEPEALHRVSRAVLRTVIHDHDLPRPGPGSEIDRELVEGRPLQRQIERMTRAGDHAGGAELHALRALRDGGEKRDRFPTRFGEETVADPDRVETEPLALFGQREEIG